MFNGVMKKNGYIITASITPTAKDEEVNKNKRKKYPMYLR